MGRVTDLECEDARICNYLARSERSSLQQVVSGEYERRAGKSIKNRPSEVACVFTSKNQLQTGPVFGFGSVSPRNPSPLPGSNPHHPPKHFPAFSSLTRCSLTKGVCVGDRGQGRCKEQSFENRFGLVLLFRRSPCNKFSLRSTVPSPLSELQSALLSTRARTMALAGVLKHAHAAASPSQALTARFHYSSAVSRCLMRGPTNDW